MNHYNTIVTTKTGRTNITATVEETAINFKRNGWKLFEAIEILEEIERQGETEITFTHVQNRLSQFAKLHLTGLTNLGNNWYEWA